MKLKFVAAAALTCCLGFGSALAQGEPQAVRQDMMKQVGNAMGVLTAIARGQRTYDAEAVRTSVATISEVAKLPKDLLDRRIKNKLRVYPISGGDLGQVRPGVGARTKIRGVGRHVHLRWFLGPRLGPTP